VCGVYLAQNLTGNLIANQAVYFFERKLSSSLF
jgi:SP family general alpha glucoside:H+ symporter-like MFS transporter